MPQADAVARVTTISPGANFKGVYCSPEKQGAGNGQTDFGGLMDDMMDKFQLGGGREASGGTTQHSAAFPNAFQFGSKAKQPNLNPGPVRDPPLMPMTHGIPVPGNVSPHRSPRTSGQMPSPPRASRAAGGKLFPKGKAPGGVPNMCSPAKSPRIAAFKGGTVSAGAGAPDVFGRGATGGSPGIGMAGMSLHSPTAGVAHGPGRSGPGSASPIPSSQGVVSPARGSLLMRFDAGYHASGGSPGFAQSPMAAHGGEAQPMYPPVPANAPVIPNHGGAHIAFSAGACGMMGLSQASHQPARQSASGSSDRLDAHVPVFHPTSHDQAAFPTTSGPFGVGLQHFAFGDGTQVLGGTASNTGGAAVGSAFVSGGLSHMPFGWAQPPAMPTPSFASPSNTTLPGTQTCRCGHVIQLAASHCSICGSANLLGGPQALTSIESPNAMVFSFSSPSGKTPQQPISQNPPAFPRDLTTTSPGTPSGGSVTPTPTAVPQRVYITGTKQERSWTQNLLHWRRARKRVKYNPVEVGERQRESKLSLVLEEVMRLEAELAVGAHSYFDNFISSLNHATCGGPFTSNETRSLYVEYVQITCQSMVRHHIL
jgi:hypothetical protein